jgi:hypothetical protein
MLESKRRFKSGARSLRLRACRSPTQASQKDQSKVAVGLFGSDSSAKVKAHAGHCVTCGRTFRKGRAKNLSQKAGPTSVAAIAQRETYDKGIELTIRFDRRRTEAGGPTGCLSANTVASPTRQREMHLPPAAGDRLPSTHRNTFWRTRWVNTYWVGFLAYRSSFWWASIWLCTFSDAYLT